MTRTCHNMTELTRILFLISLMRFLFANTHMYRMSNFAQSILKHMLTI